MSFPLPSRPCSWLRPAPLALLPIIAIVSCLHGERPPSVTPQQTLHLGRGDGAPEGLYDQPFGVVFASPQGETTEAAEISIVFNRPMRPLDLAGQEAPAPIRMVPAIPGSWRWVGTHALYFAPQTALPQATEVTVTVPAGTRALDGSTLAQDYVLKFSTPRPELVSTEPHDGSTGLKPNTRFTVRFNQPIASDEIARSLSLLVGAKQPRPAAFEVRRPDPGNDKLAELVPRAPLPLDTDIALVASASLRGVEGSLPSGREVRNRYRTYGPLTISDRDLSCSRDTPHGKCAPHAAISLTFSNPVKLADLRAAVTVTPPIAIRWRDYGEDYASRYQVVDASFAPGRDYTIRIKGSLKDTYGQSLGRDAELRIPIDDFWPSAEVGVTGTYFEPAAVRDIAIATVNVSALDLATAPVEDEGIGLFAWQKSDPNYEAIAGLRGAKSSRLHPNAAPNVMVKQIVKPADVLGGAGKRGSMVIAARYVARPGTPEARNVTEVRLVQVTDLGISAKISRFGSLVWVSRLSDGKPVANAEVRIRWPNRAPSDDFVVRTDASGLASIDGSKLSPVRDARSAPIIIVRYGDDTAWRNSSDLLYGWRYGVATDLFGDLHPFGLVFTERGVYRPGDSVHIKGILRKQEPKGTSTPAGQPVVVKVTTPTGDNLVTRSLQLDPFGAFSTEVRLPATAELGSYGIDVAAGATTDSSNAYASFDVAEYRPAEFKVGVELDRRSYVRGDQATCAVRGDYLFGAPMADAQVRTTITRGTTWFSPPGVDGFVTSDIWYVQDRDDLSQNAGQIHSGRSKLDNKGAQRVDVALAMPGQRNTEVVTCEAEVMDLSRQTVASSSTSIVHPAEFYLALRGPTDFAKTGDDIAPEVLAVDPDGKKRPGITVGVDLIRRTWVTARESAGRGAMHTVSKPVDTVVSSCSATTGMTPASCKLKASRAGYFIMRASARDRRGNPVAASTYAYVLGTGETGWLERDDHALELVPDKNSYEVGDTARILVKSPFKEAEALITVERSGVHTQRQVTLQGSMPTISVPITDDMRPNGYVSVVMLRGRSKPVPAAWNAPDAGAPSFRVGYANLRINPEAQRLAVTLTTAKSDYRPGEAVEVDLQVKDRAGKGTRSGITLYAVDEGVLMLTGYKTPDPIPVFTEPRALQVGYNESRTELARLTLSPLRGAVGEDKGLEGGGGGAGVRRDFRQSAYFNPSIVTDDSGKAHVSFKLPEGLTTYRIMAVVAAADDRFGFAESRVTTSLPLLARPAFPRLLRAGDQIRAGVVVTSKSLPRARVDVTVAAQGVELTDPPQASIDLAPGESKEVTFGFQAPRVGNAKFRFQVAGAGQSDAVEFTRQIKPPLALEAVAMYGATQSSSGEKLGDLSAMRPDVGGLDITVASTALVGMKGSVDYLIDYPYLCTEQLTSRLVPLIPLRELAREYQIDLPPNADAIIASTVAQIVRRQRHDGGFGMWEDSPQSSAWATAYAVWGLGLASRSGKDVPRRTLDAGTDYLRRYLEHWNQDPLGAATAAFMLDVLAENGKADPGYMNRLYEERSKLPLFAKAYLAHAMAVGKGDAQALADLAGDLQGHIRLNGNQAVVTENTGNAYAPLMDSSIRTQALTLRALIAAQPTSATAAQLARGLLAQRKDGRWGTTQESAYALLALDEYRKAQEKDTPDFVARAWIGDDKIIEQPMTGRSTKAFAFSIPAERVHGAGGSTLAFQLGGEQKGTLFYEARLRYARAQMPRTPIDRGFFIQKTMRVVSPEGLADALRTVPGPGAMPEPKGGELVLVDLLVASPRPQEFVVIDDPLPAGLEAIDSRLAINASSTAVAGSGGEDNAADGEHDEDDEERIARGGALLPSWYRQEIRDDRVLYFVDHMAVGLYHYRYLARATTIGTFVMPPARVEAMYQPEVFGRTAGAAFRVVAP
jgi:uncharacterized protein YfaS (alpha-2-macroglobulin family)